MAITKVRVAGAWVTKPQKVRVAGVWVTKPTYVRVAGAWVAVTFSAISSTPNPVYASGTSGVISASATLAGHSGAVSWAYVSGNASITINDSASASPTWSTTPANGQLREAVWRVTDSVSATLDLAITLENTSPV